MKITGAQASSMADRMLSTVDAASIDPAIEKAKVVARKLKKDAKVAAKHTKGKICGDELINLAKMYDNKIKVKVFDPKKLNKLVDEAVIKMTATKKAKEAKKLICKSGIKNLKGYNVPKPVSVLKNPLKLTLAEQYPEIAKMVPETKSFVDFKVKVNAKQLLQNKVINNV